MGVRGDDSCSGEELGRVLFVERGSDWPADGCELSSLLAVIATVGAERHTFPVANDNRTHEPLQLSIFFAFFWSGLPYSYCMG
jgi:hypothetical protein